MAKKYYAVKIGRCPGVYDTWDSCKQNVHGFPGAVYKSFPTKEEAIAFAQVAAAHPQTAESAGPDQTVPLKKIAGIANEKELSAPGTYAFVDGSYNSATKVYGFGGFLVHDGAHYVLQGHGKDPEMASMRNVAGEILGSQAAVAKAIELGLEEVTIYYDYMGIEMWATGVWKRNKTGTIAYYEYMKTAMKQILIRFVKVKGHSGVDGNEEADRLAKEAVGNL